MTKIIRAAAADISNLVNCPQEIVKEFALLATSRDAFGDPSGWTAIQVNMIFFKKHLATKKKKQIFSRV